jgi:hypothetical protein
MLLTHRKRQRTVWLYPLILLLPLACTSPTGRVAGGLGTASDITTACSVGIDLSVLDKDGSPEICYDSDKEEIAFTLMNHVNNRIVAVDIEVYSTGGAFPLPRSYSKDKGILFHGRSFYSLDYGDIQRVRFTPLIEVDGQLFPCQGKAISADEIGTC